MPRTALFVIDIQNELAGSPQTQIPGAARIRAAGERILATSRALADGTPENYGGGGGGGIGRVDDQKPGLTVFVQHEESPESGGTLVRDAEPWKLVFPPREGAADEILVAKTTHQLPEAEDTFESNPDLADKLKDAGVDHIVAFGLQSEYCVGSTCKGALAAGFRVSLLQGAHSTYDGDGKTASEIEKDIEEMLASRGADIVPWESAVSQWQTAGVVC
ncbi:isochorismatase hydrolase [Cordyceps javanica]|uniref:Isochorismatase hydrolase n=1 Tax=Cordyceps javanica TaxID=43265 RepID=A0A545VZF7_9HYPO|nr:isochorismatase hydrolase [Cordyceps javanica]TQW07110.1 isochorismatase hydrolase [Cordyceps javanica]